MSNQSFGTLADFFSLSRIFPENVIDTSYTWNYLKPPETTWNHLKPPETTWNHLKPAKKLQNHLKPARTYKGQ